MSQHQQRVSSGQSKSTVAPNANEAEESPSNQMGGKLVPINHLSGANTNLRFLFTCGQYSDITVKCGSDEYHLHRAVICPQAKFFERACTGAFVEAMSGTIDLSDDEPTAVRKMLTYLYTSTFEDAEPASKDAMMSTPDTESTVPLRSHADSKAERKASYLAYKVPAGKGRSRRLAQRAAIDKSRRESAQAKQEELVQLAQIYALGGKYDIQPLKDLAKTKFDALLKPGGLPPDFPTIQQYVYESTPESDTGLRETVLWKATMLHQWVGKDAELRGMLLSDAGFAVEILRASSKSWKRERKGLALKLSTKSEQLREARALLGKGKIVAH